MRKTEFAQQAQIIIALAKQKNLHGQAAKMKSYQRHETADLCLAKKTLQTIMTLKVKVIERVFHQLASSQKYKESNAFLWMFARFVLPLYPN